MTRHRRADLVTGGVDTITAGTIVAFTTVQARLLMPLMGLMRVALDLQTSAALFARIFEYLDLVPAIRDADDAKDLDQAPGPRGRIEFDDVVFRYPDAAPESRPTLDGVSFVAEPGSHVAFVGPSGAGKTTILYLTPRLYEASAGTVRFGGRTYPVRRVEHANALWVPDRDKLPLKPVAVTMTYDNGRKPVSVIALPGLFRQMSTADHAEDLDKLFLNSAIHELTHTRHVAVFAHRIDSLRTKHRLPEDLGDNLIEDRFSADTAYAPMWELERDALFQAVFARHADTARAFVREALDIAERRKQIFFYDYTAGYSDVEDLFLVLEGTGMWAQFQSENIGVPAARLRQSTESFLRRARTWSQLEGAMLFLLLDRFSPGWQTRFMSSAFPSPFTALRSAVR